jgi:anhydro-N-acetylmuramic acid kinase
MTNTDEQLFVGVMTGTSMDAIDVVIARFAGSRPTLADCRSQPLDSDLREELLSVTGDTPLAQVAELDVRMGNALADAVLSTLKESGLSPEAVHAIGCHGQTVYHMTARRWPATVQLGDPNIIAERTGITTVADFRRRDLAAGGEGAPLAPAFHRAFFSHPLEDRIVINIGGMANLTYLPAHRGQQLTGFDVGPGNVLMDGWIAQQRGETLDKDGAWAATGTVDKELLARMRAEPFFALPPPKSTGRDLFNMNWVLRHIADGRAIPDGADVQATLCELTAGTIAEAVTQTCAQPQQVMICGGGAHNKHLMRRLAAHLPQCDIVPTDTLGIGADWVEAAGFAWLAREALAGRPANAVSVTGARHPAVLGGVYHA